MNRAGKALHTPDPRDTLPLPLHILPQRIPPGRQQSRRRV
jgi:hypothetical protein